MLELLLAVAAGFLTFAAPCILPVLPIILGAAVGQSNKTRPLFIVLGFVVVFSAFTFIFGAFSQSLGFDTNTLRAIARVLLLMFGLFLLFPVVFERVVSPLVSRLLKSADPRARPTTGNWNAFVLGGTLGLVWTPCAGPILGVILTLIFQQTELARAAILLVAYAVGAGLPMLALAYGGQYVTTKVRAITRYSGQLQKVFGVLIVLLAVSMFFGYDLEIQRKLLEFYPGGQLML
ncbi:MAG: cytochrome c biogenesis protein CcdA [Candidatus Doudnabacteria bacterium]|nr:cytochrome c biogenesis protein CcdA [Candidatus Doudnabacteria bacterium]